MAILNANLSNYKTQEGGVVVPPGEYNIRIIDSQIAQAKSSGANLLKMTFEIQGPTYHGVKLYDNFVLNNAIAMSRLKTLAFVAGHSSPDYIRDTEELHGLTCLVKVKVEEDEKYGQKNKITSFKKDPAKNNNAPLLPAPPLPPQPQFAPPAQNQFAPPPPPPPPQMSQQPQFAPPPAQPPANVQGSPKFPWT